MTHPPMPDQVRGSTSPQKGIPLSCQYSLRNPKDVWQHPSLAPAVQKLYLSHPGFEPKTCPLRERAANQPSQSELGGMGTFVQWLVLQPEVLPANTVSNEASSAQRRQRKLPVGRRREPKLPKLQRRRRKLPPSTVTSIPKLQRRQRTTKAKKATKTPKGSSNKKAKVDEPAKGRKPKSDQPLRRVDTNVRTSTKKRRRHELTDTDNSDASYDDDDNSSDY